MNRSDDGSGDPSDLAGFQALRADPHAPRLVLDHNLGDLQIGQPFPLGARSPEFPGTTMHVPDILTILGSLIADVASLSQVGYLLSAGFATSHLIMGSA